MSSLFSTLLSLTITVELVLFVGLLLSSSRRTFVDFVLRFEKEIEASTYVLGLCFCFLLIQTSSHFASVRAHEADEVGAEASKLLLCTTQLKTQSSQLKAFAAGIALVFLRAVWFVANVLSSLHSAQLSLSSMTKQATSHQGAILEELEVNQDEREKLEREITKLKHEAQTERVKAEGMKRQAESQASTFEQLMYENQSLKDQLRQLDRSNAHFCKKDN